MNTTKLLRIIGKLLSFCFTAGYAVAHAIKVKRIQRGDSWIQRTRFAGLFERFRRIAKAVAITVLVLLIVLIILTSL